MSTFEVRVVRVEEIRKHPNADNLSIVPVFGYQTTVRTTDFKLGDLAAYLPVDTAHDPTQPELAFYAKHSRIRASKIRGIFSEGLLIPARAHWKLGDDVADELNCKKYEPPISSGAGEEDDPCQPDWFNKYTDLEHQKRYPHVLRVGELITALEKVDGENFRACKTEGLFHVGSHGKKKLDNGKGHWFSAARRHGLDKATDQLEDILFVGELYGKQKLRYGKTKGQTGYALFDMATIRGFRYLTWDEIEQHAKKLEIPTAPVLYRGPWSPELISLAEGRSTVPGANHIREGIVIRPDKERWEETCGRVIFKVINPEYRLGNYDSHGH